MLKKRSTARNAESFTRLFKKAYNMADGATQRARLKGLPCDSMKTIADECLRQMIQTRGSCPYLYKRYKMKAVAGGSDFSPSLDKKIPSKGYVIGNIEVMSMRANRIKTDADSLEVRAVADAMALRGL